MWLVAVDTMQIQPYIFGSNRLRENVGASYLVGAVTGDWAFKAVRKVAPRNNLGDGNTLIDDAWIERDDLDAEVLYAGGGNFVVLFGGDDERAKGLAKQFTALLSQHVLLEAPGLQLVIAGQQMNWHEEALRDKRNEVFRLLDMQKRKHARSAPLLGLSVTAACRSTGLPATGLVRGIKDEPPYLASDEIRAKVDVATHHGDTPSQADQRLQEIIGLPEGYSYPADFDDMGATPGEYSHIAIVHADGNSVGQRIQEICNQYRKKKQNRDLVQALRHFSLNLAQAAQQALKAVLDSLKREIDKRGGTSIVYEPNKELLIQIDLVKKKNRKSDYYYLPFRPIVFGGDDVTFVCDGRLGLSLAAMYLREFEQRTAAAKLGKDGGGLTACAGIAIVKSHYPFARAYELADELSKTAKTYRQGKIAGSCLDWHFALSGLGSSITEIRKREYKVEAGDLALRPVTLRANPKHSQRAWPVVVAGINAFQGEEWVKRRNKIKALRDSLRDGADAVKHFIVTFNNRQPLPPVLPGMDEWPLTGWQGGYCGYFDALELVDWFIPLEGEADATPANEPVP
jgi:hypothetical protein